MTDDRPGEQRSGPGLWGVLLGGFLLGWSLFWIPLALAAHAVRRDQTVMLRMARRFWARGIVRVYATRLDVLGADKLDPRTTCLFVANHLSHLDVPILMRAIPFGVRFLAKQQLREVPLLGRYIQTAGMVFVERSSPRRAMESLALLTAKLRSGQSFVAFPEGGRSRTGELGNFKLGAFKAAIDAGVPVVPVAIQGSVAIWPAESTPRQRGPVRISVGQLRSTQGLTAADASALSVAVRKAVQQLSVPAV